MAVITNLLMLFYNIKWRTAVNIETDTLAEIARIPNVVAVKEASGDISQMADVIAQVSQGGDKPFYVVSGDDALTLPLMSLGGHGVVSVVGNLVPGRKIGRASCREWA